MATARTIIASQDSHGRVKLKVLKEGYYRSVADLLFDSLEEGIDEDERVLYHTQGLLDGGQRLPETRTLKTPPCKGWNRQRGIQTTDTSRIAGLKVNSPLRGPSPASRVLCQSEDTTTRAVKHSAQGQKVSTAHAPCSTLRSPAYLLLVEIHHRLDGSLPLEVVPLVESADKEALHKKEKEEQGQMVQFDVGHKQHVDLEGL